MTEHILAAFQRLRATDPDRRLFSFVDEKGQPEASLTVRELGDAADRVVEAVREWGFQPGDRAILVYPPSLDFVGAFLGCLAAGVLPVPVYPPNPFKLKKDLATFTAIVDNCGARGVLTNSFYDRSRTAGTVTSFFSKDAPSWPSLGWYRTDKKKTVSGPVTWHDPGLGDPAFLQYTSGSTATPKGVILTHGNLAHEVTANAADLGLGPDTRGVFWVPQYHDLGLISVICSTIAGNGRTTLMSPMTFLQRPSVWFDVMARVRATHTAAPNFAFELAVRKTTPAQRAAWDLGSLRVVMSAAEPIRPSTVDAFFTAFADTGLKREVFYPAYGLAETSVSVSMGGRAVLTVDKSSLESGKVVAAPDGVTYLGCGRITKPGAVRIVDPATGVPCREDEVGEIWVDSPTKGLGYWGMESGETFHARVDGEDGDYLRTGDLGFFHEDELFITGRLKDLIIVRGRNLYPSDIEDCVRDVHPLVRPGGVAAFAVDHEQGEQLVLFVETKQEKVTAADVDGIVEAVRRQVYDDHQLACHAVVVGKAGTVRKTTSGKVRRLACKQAFVSGEITSSPATIRVSVQQSVEA
ncbi:Acyl-CoA synthetase (AMP-forming)/AMP-acid ligase II [Amycolatopsis xylanica]|uniref:Acyl-CoA synthetase (AMP-forming)/AMP-acid ligase II n=1 Tax=Amycolatopsis xylanica TaxID=589385 RepID=A0A1H3K4A1_9PSEU|nr:fatty acyl-AMP ligase [Amycolatopsis xylanica]SDY47006.1 Acyl-CoA synthetase (AMP-forming)/AMP-acid ligase II [Amycolatopsis xylanica]